MNPEDFAAKYRYVVSAGHLSTRVDIGHGLELDSYIRDLASRCADPAIISVKIVLREPPMENDGTWTRKDILTYTERAGWILPSEVADKFHIVYALAAQILGEMVTDGLLVRGGSGAYRVANRTDV